MPTGRPSDYTPEIADRICQWLAGGQSLRAFCKQDNTPALSTVCLWIVTHDQFSEQYKRAREAAGYAHADEIADIANRVLVGEVDPQAARVAMDGKKWAAERMAPKTHMPQSLINHESPGGTMSPKPGIDLSKAPDDVLKWIVSQADERASED